MTLFSLHRCDRCGRSTGTYSGICLSCGHRQPSIQKMKELRIMQPINQTLTPELVQKIAVAMSEWAEKTYSADDDYSRDLPEIVEVINKVIQTPPTRPVAEFVKHVKELDFTIVADVQDYWVNYKIYDIFGWSTDVSPCWQKREADGGYTVVEDFMSADVYVHGNVKWDGCSNWHFDEQDHVMLHGCCKKDVERFGTVLAICWDWTAELLGSWQGA